ncbi:hypothetical protein PISL3812_01141 [Talaromyces islandicus]|uniref:NAD(P)-binding protein n=1 Tax=Talaromyces islandicus TaxID=28573 RepID=A0A0U1LLF7_TALIS|nr:hypothetical protein PISL3812_01141 [Talaromyces islandicus]
MSSYAITGASKGIGREFVRQLAANTANTVLAVVRDPESPGISELASKYANVHLIKGDATDPKSLLEAASTAAAITGGTLDVLIHNSNAVDMASAGLSPSQLPFDAEALRAIYDKPLSTAVYGGIWTTNAFLPLIEKGTQKKIVHISSAMADSQLIKTSGISYAVPYAAAKAGMNVQVAKYAAELAPKGIKVLALSPGWVDTWEGEKSPEVQQILEVMLKEFQAVEPELKGQISPEESVGKCLQVIERLDAENSGLLLSQHGNTTKWLRIMQQMPDSSLPLEVRSRILELSEFANLYRAKSPSHPFLASIIAIQNAYKSGQLVVREGMVSYCKWASQYGNGIEEVILLERPTSEEHRLFLSNR